MMILVIKLFIDNWITLGLAREGRAVFLLSFCSKKQKNNFDKKYNVWQQ